MGLLDHNNHGVGVHGVGGEGRGVLDELGDEGDRRRMLVLWEPPRQ